MEKREPTTAPGTPPPFETPPPPPPGGRLTDQEIRVEALNIAALVHSRHRIAPSPRQVVAMAAVFAEYLNGMDL